MTVTDRRRGIVLMMGAGLCWSLGGIIVRKLTIANPWEIVFWRAFFMAAFLSVLLLALRGHNTASAIRAIGRAGVVAGACLALQIYCFILALQNTTAANTFVLMSLSPLAAALAGALFLHEQVTRHTWAIIAIALTGIAIMFSDGLNSGRWLGNVLALCIPAAYGCQILLLRKVRGVSDQVPDLLPTLLVGGVIGMTPALFLSWPLSATGDVHDLSLLAVMGCIQLGLGCWLMTLAIPHLRAAEMGLLALTETILAPLWVWLGVGEAPGVAALAGGTLIIGALVINALMPPTR